jgi:hypothetical protein
LPSASGDRVVGSQKDSPAGEGTEDQGEETREPPAERIPPASAVDGTGPIPGSYEDAVSDPVVQDLIRRGGQVTDVQTLPEQ